jgi:hypothetical protein
MFIALKANVQFYLAIELIFIERINATLSCFYVLRTPEPVILGFKIE